MFSAAWCDFMHLNLVVLKGWSKFDHLWLSWGGAWRERQRLWAWDLLDLPCIELRGADCHEFSNIWFQLDQVDEPYAPLVRIWINCMCFWYLEITGRKMSVEFQRTAPCASTPKCRWSKGRLRKQRPNVSWKPNKRLGHWPGIERDRGVESSCLGAMSIDSINLTVP